MEARQPAATLPAGLAIPLLQHRLELGDPHGKTFHWNGFDARVAQGIAHKASGADRRCRVARR